MKTNWAESILLLLLTLFLTDCGETPQSEIKKDARYLTKSPWHGTGKWFMGDTHIHTIHSDGDYTPAEVAGQAAFYGCDFIAFTNHDVSVPADELASVREANPSLLIFQGTEWSVPAGEHCCVIVPKHPDETEYIDAFLQDFSRRYAPHKPNTEADAVNGLAWLSSHPLGGLVPLAMINHPSRANAYSLNEILEYSSAGEALIGFSGAPGHCGREPYADSTEGWDFVYAQVGDQIDILLQQGKRIWGARAPSDFHGIENDYWPGEYSRTHVYAADKTHKSILEAYRFGAAYADQDRICKAVEFTLESGRLKDVIPGEQILIDQGDDVNVRISVEPHPGVKFDEVEFISNKNQARSLCKSFRSNEIVEQVVSFDAPWRYLFPAEEPTGWTGTKYDDSSWDLGIGLFGYGFPDVRTVLDEAIDDAFNRGRKTIPNDFPTAYFRRSVFVEGLPDIDSLLIDVQFGDGLVLYVNGREGLRLNMPDGQVGHKTSAKYPKNFATTTHTVSKELFREGRNVISVRLHQSFESGQSGDEFNYVKDFEGREHGRFNLQLRTVLAAGPRPDWEGTGDRIEMDYTYSNLTTDFYVRARGRSMVPYGKWFYTNPIFVKVRGQSE